MPDIIKFQVGDLVKWWLDAPGYAHGLGIVIARERRPWPAPHKISVYWFCVGRAAMHNHDNLLEVS